jgi:filamentous hemagglutinin family protein
MMRRAGHGRRLLALAAGTVLVWPLALHAEVTTDGRLGAKVRLSGKDVTIPARLGQIRGKNLFHSFERFGIGPGGKVTFTGPDGLKNVIGRVTGGAPSRIDGTLASKVKDADLWLLNPAGILFGPKARLELPGSFHASTADELRLADGKVFSALDPQGSVLSVAAPAAFGFLGARPAAIDVKRSLLKVRKGEALSLTAGDIVVRGSDKNNPRRDGLASEPGTVRARAGQITLATSGGPGEVGMGAASGTAAGTIRLSDKAAVVTSGSGGGMIRIRGERLVVENNSSIFADNLGAADATGGIAIEAKRVTVEDRSEISTDVLKMGKGSVVAVRAGTLSIRDRSVLHSNTNGTGHAGEILVDVDRLHIAGDGSDDLTGIATLAAADATGQAGRVTVTADTIDLRRGGVIASNTIGAGNAGEVTVAARQSLIVDGKNARYDAGIFSSSSVQQRSTAAGDAGKVTIQAGTLTLRNRGLINTATFASGDAGEIEVTADKLVIVGDGLNSFTGITSHADYQILDGQVVPSLGDAGKATITAGTIELRNGGAISSATFGHGNGGEVVVAVKGKLLVDHDGGRYLTGISSGSVAAPVGGQWIVATGDAGTVTVMAGAVELRDGGTISSATLGPGKAGDVSIAASRLSVRDDGEIQSSGDSGGGPAGNIRVDVDERLSLDHGFISTESYQGGGSITLSSDGILDLARRSDVSTTVFGGAGTTAGDIAIHARSLVLNDSRVLARADAGRGGNIRITADDILTSAGSRIDASSQLGVDGTVTTSSPEADLTGAVTVVPTVFLDAENLLRESCAAGKSVTASSFTGVGRGGLPPDPAGPLAAPYHRPNDARTNGPLASAGMTPSRPTDAALRVASGCLPSRSR